MANSTGSNGGKKGKGKGKKAGKGKASPASRRDRPAVWDF
jgi:hypothetical protein